MSSIHSTTMATSTPTDIFQFFDLPYVPREQIFANMCPSALVSLYHTFKTAYTFFPYFTGEMSIKFCHENPKILVIGSNGKRSILPFAAHKSLSMIYSHLQLIDISVEMNEDSRPEDYADLLKFIGRFVDRNVKMVRVFSKDKKVLNLESIQKLFDVFESVKEIQYPNRIANYPMDAKKVRLVDIGNGAHLTSEDIRRVCKTSKEVRIKSSRWSDSTFNQVIWDWLNGANKRLRYLEISAATQETVHGLRVLMEGIPFVLGDGGDFEAKFLKKKVHFHTGLNIQRWDGRRATVVRTHKKFKFIVWH